MYSGASSESRGAKLLSHHTQLSIKTAKAKGDVLLRVLRSAAGHYIGTQDDEGPVSRESVEYFPTHLAAQRALDTHAWTQRAHP